MGVELPPFYGKETILEKVKKISEIDVKINELLIARESYVEDLEKAVAEEDNK